jgi:hypothetical protein
MLDKHNFVSLVPPQTPGMLRVAAALVGRADAEDVTQEAVLQAWRSWSSLRSIETLRPWLLRISPSMSVASGTVDRLDASSAIPRVYQMRESRLWQCSSRMPAAVVLMAQGRRSET